MAVSLSNLIPGDDIFISYSRLDGATYATALANQLASRRLSCRFDQWVTVPGITVPDEMLKALRRSGMLIIVGTEGACNSSAVEREIKEFLPTRRVIIPLELCSDIKTAKWWPHLAGLPISGGSRSSSIQQPSDSVSGELLDALIPSNEVISRIENSIGFTKKDRRLRQTSVAALIILVFSLIAAVAAGLYAARKNGEALEQQHLTQAAMGNQRIADQKRDEATLQAAKQTSIAEKAEERQRLAEQKIMTAELALASARKETANAVIEQKINRTVAASAAETSEDPEKSLVIAAGAAQIAQSTGSPNKPLVIQALLTDLQTLGGIGLRAGNQPVGAVTFSADSSQLIVASQDQTIRTWALDKDRNRQSESGLTGIAEYPDSIGRSHNGQWTICRAMRDVSIWMNGDPAPVRRWHAGKDQGGQVPVFVTNSQMTVAIVGDQHSLYLLDLEQNSRSMLVRQVVPHQGYITAMALTDDGATLVTGAEDGIVRTWSLKNGTIGVTPTREWNYGDIDAHSRGVGDVGISPDGRWIIAKRQGLLDFERGDRSGRIWDLSADGGTAHPFIIDANSTLSSFLFSTAGNLLFTIGPDTSKIWRLPKQPGVQPSAAPLTAFGRPLTRLTLSKDGQWMAGITANGQVAVWALDKRDSITDPTLLQGLSGEVTALDIDASGRWLVGGSRTGSLRLWSLNSLPDITGPVSMRARLSYGDSVSDPIMSKGGEWLVTNGEETDNNGVVSVWNTKRLKSAPESQIKLRRNFWRPTADIDPAGRWLITIDCESGKACDAVGRRLTTVGLAGEPTLITNQLSGGINNHAFAPSGRWFASVLTDGRVLLSDLGTEAATSQTLPAGLESVREVLFSDDDRWLVVTRFEKPSTLYENVDGDWRYIRDVAMKGVNPEMNAKFAFRSSWLVFTGPGTQTSLSRLSDGYEISNDSPNVGARHLAFSPKGDLAAAISEKSDESIDILELGSTDRSVKANIHLTSPVAISGLVFSPKGDWLLGVKKDDKTSVVLWNLRQRLSNKIGTLLVGRGWKSQRSFEFSPGERWLIFYDINDPGVELWDLQKSTIERYSTELTGHVSGIGTIRFSQNDEWLVTMSSDSTARLWNLAKGLTRTTSTQLKGHRWNVTWAEFTDDDKALITASYSDGTIRVWPLSVTSLLDAAERVAGRNLTFNEWQELNSGDAYRPVFADLPVDESAARSLAHEARKRAEAGDLISAKALFISANDIASKASDPEVSNFVCWWGSLYGFASDVVASGENAVRLAPTSVDYRDTRGVTRVLLKDYKGAAADFEYVIAGSTPDSPIVRERSGWIHNLRRGLDPFNANELKQLRIE